MGTMAEVTLRETDDTPGGLCTVLRQTDGIITSAQWHVLSCRAERKQASWLACEGAGCCLEGHTGCQAPPLMSHAAVNTVACVLKDRAEGGRVGV